MEHLIDMLRRMTGGDNGRNGRGAEKVARSVENGAGEHAGGAARAADGAGRNGSGAPLSAVAVAQQVRSGQTSAVGVIAGALERAAAAQEQTNAFITIAAEQAMAAAERIDARVAAGDDAGPLAGVPLVVKDNLVTAGIRTTAGSRMLADFVPPYDATVVQRLVDAGAVVIGKANLDEFGMGSGNENSTFGPVRNPVDPTRVAGGSSGGSAAAVATDAAPLALGSDTGGSARLPAAFCGVIGFKPSYGALSRYGLMAYGSSLDQVGILGNDLEDVSLAFHLAAGEDPLDPTTFGASGGAAAALPDLTGVRIGLVTELMSLEGAEDGFSEEALAEVRRAAAMLAERGAQIVELSVPSVVHAPACYYVAATAEASSNLARFDGTLFGGRVGSLGDGQEAVMSRVRDELFGPEVKRRLLFGSLALSDGYYDRYYGQALKVRRLISDQLQAALQNVDMFLLPSAASVAFHLGASQEEPFGARFGGHSYYSDMATSLANLAGLPALSVPFGAVGGLPLGVQLMGAAQADRSVLALAGHLV